MDTKVTFGEMFNDRGVDMVKILKYVQQLIFFQRITSDGVMNEK